MLRYFLLLCNKMISDTYKYDSVTVANYIIAFANQNKLGRMVRFSRPLEIN